MFCAMLRGKYNFPLAIFNSGPANWLPQFIERGILTATPDGQVDNERWAIAAKGPEGRVGKKTKERENQEEPDFCTHLVL